MLDLVRTRDSQLLQQVWPDLTLWMLLTCVELFLDRLQPDNDDQRAHAMSPCCKPVLRKISRNLAVAKERVRRKNLIDLVHQIDDQLVLSSLHRPVRLRSVFSLRIISRRSDRLIASALVTKNHFPPPADQSWREAL